MPAWRVARGRGTTPEKSNGVSADDSGESDRVVERLLEALANYPEAKRALRDALGASGRLPVSDVWSCLWYLYDPIGVRSGTAGVRSRRETGARAAGRCATRHPQLLAAVGEGSELWLMSTPFGQRGFFWETWERGGRDWLRVSVPATECSRISAEFLEEERAALGERWYRQEYLCEFTQPDDAFFDEELLRDVLD